MQVFVFDSVGRTIPTLVDALPGAPIYPLPGGGGVQRITSDSLQKLAGGTHIQRTTDPQALTALAVLNYRETTRFDPLTGRPLLFDEHGAATVTHQSRSHRAHHPGRHGANTPGEKRQPPALFPHSRIRRPGRNP